MPIVFDALYLFHLRYVDLGRGLTRLAKTRAMPWADAAAGTHQRVDDAAWENMLRRIAGLPRQAVAFDAAEPPLADWLARLRASLTGRERDTYR